MSDTLSPVSTVVTAATLGVKSAKAAFFSARGETDAAKLERAFGDSFEVAKKLAVSRVAKIRKDDPAISDDQLLTELEDRYVRDVTGTGALVGAAAAIPGIGTMAALAATVGDAGLFMTSTMVHVFAVLEATNTVIDDVDLERSVVLTVLLGGTGSGAAKKVAKELGAKSGTGLFSALRSGSGKQISKALGQKVLTRYMARQTGFFFGKALPFGVGAVIGGTLNRGLGKTMTKATRATVAELKASA